MVYKTPDGAIVHAISFVQTTKAGALNPIIRSIDVSIGEDPALATALHNNDMLDTRLATQQAAAGTPAARSLGKHQVLYWAAAERVPAPKPDAQSAAGATNNLPDQVVTRDEFADDTSTAIVVSASGVPASEVEAFITEIRVN